MASPHACFFSLLAAIIFVLHLDLARAITLHGSDSSYARYPPWIGCQNDSFSFEFKSTQDQGLLWYVDDGGTSDFFEIMMTGGKVRLVMNIVDEREGSVEITVGHRVNDGRWHKVEVRRRRMETVLKVDGVEDSRFSFGSDFHFGRGGNSYVYVGGLPSELSHSLEQMALPSALFQPRFKGTVRNVVYGNCSCRSQRALMVDGVGVTQFPPEACELRNPCRDGCVCITTDTGTNCDCAQLQCVTGTVTHYELPMDRLSGTTLVNPSGLDSTAFGQPPLSRGIRGNAIQCNGRDKYIRVSGPGHRLECFGDLDKCANGYTLAFWVNFTNPGTDGKFVYLSNGGHSATSHGVAMLYDRGQLEFIFKKQNGDEWLAAAKNILLGRWYHVAATWSPTEGLSLYINGDLASSTSSLTRGRPVAASSSQSNDFVIGKANEVGSSSFRDHSMLIDEFNFWSMYKSANNIRENGPFFSYHLPMNSRSDIERGSARFSVHGNPVEVTGKTGNALQFDGRQDYISSGDQSASCLGNLTMCQYGVTAGMWVQFTDLRENSYLFSTGKNGIELYYKDGKLTAEVQQGTKHWRASWTKPEAGRWYFLELTWSPDSGLEMLVDLETVAVARNYERKEAESSQSNNLFIGRGNSNSDRYTAAKVDDLELWYGDRERLIYFDFIQRGKPPKEHFEMDAVSGNRVVHPTTRIDMFGQPRIAPGRVGGALNLDGSNSFVSLGRQQSSCLGNLDLCRHGLLLSAWLQPGQLREGMDLMSSGINGIRVWYENGRTKVSARTTTQEWNLDTDKVKPTEWQFLEVGWDPKSGLSVYVDEDLVAQDRQPEDRRDSVSPNVDREQFYFGRGDGTRSNSRYGNFTLDNVEYWTSNRDYLLAFDYIQRGKPEHILVDMDSIQRGVVQHPTLRIPVNGNPVTVPGKINNAIRLDGSGQYIDVGDHRDTCFGNVELCKHGFTGSVLLNFRNLEDNTYYLSTGGGLRLYYADGKLFASVDKSGKRWEVGVPNIHKDKWYFVEYTWHPDKGLQLYVDNRLAGETKQSRTVSQKPVAGHVQIGAANAQDVDGGRFQYANALVDEYETWMSNRENLIAFDYIARDNISHLVFPLEQQQGNRVLQPGYSILLHNGASLTPAKVGKGAVFEGTGEYLTFGDQSNSCFGNLEKCKHGMTASFWLKPEQILDNAYYLSSGPYSVYSKNGKFYAKFSTQNKTWEVSTDRITAGNWHKVELSWDEERGLDFYVDNAKVASTDQFQTHSPLRIRDYNVYLGRPTDDNAHGRYANAVIDEVEYWFANRDLLKTLNLIGDEINHLIVDMDRINGDVLVHPDTVIYVNGNPRTLPGLIGNAVSLNGNNQFADLGRNKLCNGNIRNCPKGFTLRFKIKPNQLQENTYFVSSSPVDVFYQNNRLVAEVRSPDSVWKAYAPNLSQDAWHQVDLSWHPVDGLAMYVDSQLKDRQTVGLDYTDRYDENKNFYVGRANTNMIRERYANALFDDLQIWEAKRDYLIPDLINPDADQNLITAQTTLRPAVPSTTRTPITIPTPSPGQNKWLVFDGRAWIAYDFSQLPDDYLQKNYQETLDIRFKTDGKDGLLWYSGNASNHAHLTLKDGILFLIANTTSGTTRYVDIFQVQIPSGKLNDDKWHNVQITNEEHRVKMVVDGNEFNKYFNSDIDLVSPNVVYLGGSNDTRRLTNSHISTNFQGTLDKAVMNGDTLPSELDLINMFLIQPRPHYIHVDGNVGITEPATPSPAPERQPITFTTGQAGLRLPRWDAARSGSIEFNFRTLEPDGLIMFNGGRPDSFSVEIFDGQPYVNLDLGDGVYKYPFETKNGLVNDGEPHHIAIQRVARQLRLTLDGSHRSHTIIGGDNDLDLGSHLYVGAVDNPNQIPWQVWSRDRKFFRGCFWGLKINNGEVIDLDSYVQSQAVQGIQSGCHSGDLQCHRRPCSNGVCLERMSGPVCDCSATAFMGTRCQNNAGIAGFSGTEFVRVNFNPTRESHTNDISLRFKTQKDNGLLFATSSRGTDQYLKVLIENGQGKLETNLGGHRKPLGFGCEQPLNDNQWHTLYIKRRANYLEAHVDNCTSESTSLPGNGYTLDIDELLVAKQGHDDPSKNAFVGHIQNFYFDDLKLIEMIGGGRVPGISIDSKTNVTTSETNLLVFPSTFWQHQDAFVKLPTFEIVGDSTIHLTIKTKNKDGIILYNDGSANNYFAVELVNGILHVSADDGSGPRVITSAAPSLADNQWHTIKIKQTGVQSFNVLVDDRFSSDLTFPPSRNTLDLVDVLHVGGVPSSLVARLPSSVVSRKGFAGCVASFFVNGRLYNLQTDGIGSTSSQYITEGCTDLKTFCTATSCQHYGICSEGPDTFICNCDMTSFVGQRCNDEANGYRYGSENKPGITQFTLTPAQSTNMDQLAFGFMTWMPNGTLVRAEGPGDYVHAALVNGHVVVKYDIGDGEKTVAETRRNFSDGAYHYVSFVRNGGNATLRVDDYPLQQQFTSGATTTLFNGMQLVKIGGNTDRQNNIVDYFDGIIAGVYLNGFRVIDMGVDGQSDKVQSTGDTTLAGHRFFVPKPAAPTKSPVRPTVAPESVVNGGGAGWIPDGGDELIVVPGPGPEPGPPVVERLVAAPVDAGTGEGARAAAVAGTMLGILAAVSSVMWALYKFKPGLIGSGGGGLLNISSPLSSSRYQPVSSQDTPLTGERVGAAVGDGSAGGGGGASGKKYGSTSFMVTKADMANGGASGASASGVTSHMATQTAGAGANEFSNYYAYSASSAAGASSATAVSGHKAGTMTRAIQTDLAYQAPAGGAPGGSASVTTVRNTTVTNVYNGQQMGGGSGYDSTDQGSSWMQSQAQSGQGYGQGQGYSQGQGYGQGYGDGYTSSTFTYEASRGYAGGAQEFAGFSQGDVGYGTGVATGQGRSVGTAGSPPTDPSGLYQMRNMTLDYSALNQQSSYGQQQLQQQQQLGGSGMARQNLMTEEIRVDCVQMTNNGRYVVTGSIYGPPQVWDMKTGELVRIMQGDELSSTDLHLANGDTLLVGQVAELEQSDTRTFNSNLHFRKLQIWDFNTGRPLEMRRNELCTASCLMGDGERIVLGRTEKFGGGTTIIIWDVLGNEPLRLIKYDGGVGFADPVTYLNLSKDNRYVIAGFQNSFDQKANFISFDLTVNDFNSIPPKMIALDANIDVTAILENQEVVTGTRAGELIIWSMRTGKPLRQLVSPSRDVFSQTAHQREVTDVCATRDGQFLVSASADGTLKVWNLDSEKLLRTLAGHKDEVWCCTVSFDNEIVVSGSRDCTIRLWRLDDGVPVAAIDAGVDVFKVLLSNNKKTVVALADRYGARKLVMLQVVRTKVRSAAGSRAGSRATSPFLMDDYQQY